MATARQTLLPIAFVRNRGLFSNHWFENRLKLEPEWDGLRNDARAVLEGLAGRAKLDGSSVHLLGVFVHAALGQTRFGHNLL